MNQKQVSKALFKKLSALRATLSDEEQLLLDSLLVGEYEVTAHGRANKPENLIENRLHVRFKEDVEAYAISF